MENFIKKEWIRFQRFQSFFSLVLVKLDISQYLIDKYGSELVLNYMFQLFEQVNQSIRTYDEIKSWNKDSFFALVAGNKIRL